MRRPPRRFTQSVSLLCLVALTACRHSEPVAAPAVARHALAPKVVAPESVMPARTHDESSYAEPDKARISHLALDLTVDFDKKQLSGTATLDMNWYDKDASTLVLDTRDLSIDKIEGGDGTGDWKPLTFTLAPRDPVFGSKLTIAMPGSGKAGQMRQVRITYATSPMASGLQWLDPSMTAGKTQPFMFSQSEAIHARSWIPLQDTPGVRFSYSGFDCELPSVQESCLALALREAVTNVQRHAGAANAHAELIIDAAGVQLTVRDDGKGGVVAHGNGLDGMRERAEALGGSLRIDAARGHGTQLIVRLPPMAATNVVSLAGAQAARQASA